MSHSDLYLHTINPLILLLRYGSNSIMLNCQNYGTFITCLRKTLCISMGDYEGAITELERK